MRLGRWVAGVGAVVVSGVGLAAAMQGGQQAPPAAPDATQILVDRLDLAKYKATIKGLTQFGDRREGTQRNRDAVAWIEAQLKSYGCPTERLEYVVAPRNAGGGVQRSR